MFDKKEDKKAKKVAKKAKKQAKKRAKWAAKGVHIKHSDEKHSHFGPRPL